MRRSTFRAKPSLPDRHSGAGRPASPSSLPEESAHGSSRPCSAALAWYYFLVKPRLSPLEQRVLDAFARAVRARFGERLTALSLFGSRARGDGRDDSDLDLFVSVRALSRGERLAVIDDAADLGLEHGLVLSPLVVDADTWRSDLPLACEIARDGASL